MDTVEARLLYLEEELKRLQERLQLVEAQLEEDYDNSFVDEFGLGLK